MDKLRWKARLLSFRWAKFFKSKGQSVDAARRKEIEDLIYQCLLSDS